MVRRALSLAALTAALFASTSASAQQPPAFQLPSIPTTLPSIPSLPSTLPTTLPAIPGFPIPQAQQGAPIAIPGVDLNALLAQQASCPPIQVAPNVFIPVPCVAPAPRKQSPTPRTPKYPPRTILPFAVDLNAAGLDGPVKDQGQVGMCWAMATSSVAENALRRAGNRDTISAMHVLSAKSEKKLYAYGMNGIGLVSEAQWSFDGTEACVLNDVTNDSCGMTYGVARGTWRMQPRAAGDVARADATGRYRLRSEELSGDVDEIANLLSQGRELRVDIGIDSKAWGWSGAQGGTLPEYAVADRGGHAVTAVGYKVAMGTRWFLLKNSWGTDWGNGGYVWISDMSMRNHIERAYMEDVYAYGVNVPAQDAQTL